MNPHYLFLPPFSWLTDRRQLLSILQVVVSALLLILAFASASAEILARSRRAPRKVPTFTRLSFGKFPTRQLRVELFGPAIRDAAGPTANLDINALKTSFLESRQNARILFVSPEVQEEYLTRLAAMCSELDALCLVLTRERDNFHLVERAGLLQLFARTETDALSAVRGLGDEDFAATTSFLGLFSYTGTLVWASESSEVAALGELELLLRALGVLKHDLIRPEPLGTKTSGATSAPASAYLRPDLALSSLRQTVYSLRDGTPTTLAEAWAFKEPRPRVVAFWATWCLPCVEELPELQALATRFSTTISFAGLVFHANNQKERLKTHKLLVERGATYPQYVTEDQNLVRKLQGLADGKDPAYPFFAVFDRTGNFRGSVTGTIALPTKYSELLLLLEQQVRGESP